LTEGLRGEVRLLKKFLKGIDAYGAEIKTGGFSGYLCELLILHHKSFIDTLSSFASYKQRITIDMEGYYKGREKELKLLFPEPLVTIDPVDKGRNVASAVQPQKLYTLVGAARAYLKKPSKTFFYQPKIKALAAETLKTELDNRGAPLIFLTLGSMEAVPDVLWGQLHKTQRALRKLAELNDFKVLRDAVWSNEKTLSVFILELEQRKLSRFKKHLGPPLKQEKECENFLAKYACNTGVVSGPYIEDGRWVVQLKRRFSDVTKLLEEKLRDGGRSIGTAEMMAQAFRKKLSILANGEVSEVYRDSGEFAEFLTSFLLGKPFWLEAAEV
jgi:tRNA nucleotidyltransferase (CCA-adding enzyme)